MEGREEGAWKRGEGKERERDRESEREGELLSSPFDRFQSTALRATFSNGSPTISPSSRAKEWHVARTHCVSNGDSRAGIRPRFPPPPSEPAALELTRDREREMTSYCSLLLETAAISLTYRFQQSL